MPPTYSPWLNSFERIARFGIGRTRALDARYSGPRGGVDCMLGEDWQSYLRSRDLFELWSPPPASPWSGFHRPTLFAALDGLPRDRLWPSAPLGFDAREAPRALPAWMDARSAILLDLPAAISVAWGALLSLRAGHEPVATFNNWPHARGVVDMWGAIGGLLHHAPWQREAKERRQADGRQRAPVMLLDRMRLGERTPKPRDFDNRYFLLDSDLPTVAMLRRAGVERLVYVRPTESLLPPAPQHDEVDDMNRYLFEIAKGIPVALASLSTQGWTAGEEARAWTPTLRKTPFNTTTDPTFQGFRRSAAGGFGELVPEPSSGSGG